MEIIDSVDFIKRLGGYVHVERSGYHSREQAKSEQLTGNLNWSLFFYNVAPLNNLSS